MNLMTCVKQRARVIQVIIQWIYYSNNKEKQSKGYHKRHRSNEHLLLSCPCYSLQEFTCVFLQKGGNILYMVKLSSLK